MIQVSGVSGTFNRLSLLQRMVKSVRQSVGELTYEIIVTDGNSTDGTKEWCRQQSDIVLIEHPGLLGSAKAYQDGYERVRGKYAVTLNDDISVEGDSILRGYNYLETHPEVGQVAFGHKYQRRGKPKEAIIQKIYGGYPYAQCGMTRRWLGEAAEWTGMETEGYVYYGWDSYLSARIWELGWKVVGVPGCSVIDWEHEDELRVISGDAPRAGGKHPDPVRFHKHWKGRLPPRKQWVPAFAPSDLGRRVLFKAAAGNLRTLRFKGTMRATSPMRMACIRAFGKYGPTLQVNQSNKMRELGVQRYQQWALGVVKEFKPDLVMLQAQKPNNIMPETVREMRKKNLSTLVFNWDGDTHSPIQPFNFAVAKECHLQLVVSPTQFGAYLKQGARNIGYWPIGVEPEYLEVERGRTIPPRGPDVTFLGDLYGIGMFPQAVARREAVKRLYSSDLHFQLRGSGWARAELKVIKYTGELHKANAELYARSKMALSISQSKSLWGYTSDRLYNICGTGCPALVQSFAGMEEHGFVDGVSCIAWGTLDEMMEKARYYLKPEHETKREAIGQAGRELILTRHNWDERVKGLWNILDGLGGLHG